MHSSLVCNLPLQRSAQTFSISPVHAPASWTDEPASDAEQGHGHGASAVFSQHIFPYSPGGQSCTPGLECCPLMAAVNEAGTPNAAHKLLQRMPNILWCTAHIFPGLLSYAINLVYCLLANGCSQAGIQRMSMRIIPLLITPLRCTGTCTWGFQPVGLLQTIISSAKFPAFLRGGEQIQTFS